MLSVIFCSIAIVNILSKWHHSPVTVTFDDRATSIATIPFPAVTICPTQKFSFKNIDVTKLLEVYKVMHTNITAFMKFLPEM